jgi:transposase-like protein
MYRSVATANGRNGDWRRFSRRRAEPRSGTALPTPLILYAGDDELNGHQLPDERESYLRIVEGIQDPSVESARETQASAARPAGSRRRRLSPDEERDIARLYADTSTPTSEIRERFGIGESSLYRVVQRHGVALRGRTASSTKPNLPRTQAVAAQGRRSSTARGAKLAAPRSTPRPAEVRVSPRVGERSTRGPARRAAATVGTTSPAGLASSRTGGGARQRFRIRFQGESVFEATDIRDALRQAESLGATEITAVARED